MSQGRRIRVWRHEQKSPLTRIFLKIKTFSLEVYSEFKLVWLTPKKDNGLISLSSFRLIVYLGNFTRYSNPVQKTQPVFFFHDRDTEGVFRTKPALFSSLFSTKFCVTYRATSRNLTLYSTDTHFPASKKIVFKNIVRKGEIARNEQFILLPQCFLLNQIIVSPFVHIFDIIYLFAAELEEPKIGIWGKCLIYCFQLRLAFCFVLWNRDYQYI